MAKFYNLAEATEYVNDRLEAKWTNPKGAFERNIVLGKIEVAEQTGEAGERLFEQSTLNKFVREKNAKPNPRGGNPETDLSGYAHLFPYQTDKHIGELAGVNHMTVYRYRKRHGHPTYLEACRNRIEAAKDRVGVEPTLKLSKELKVNRSMITRYLKNGKKWGKKANKTPAT